MAGEKPGPKDRLTTEPFRAIAIEHKRAFGYITKKNKTAARKHLWHAVVGKEVKPELTGPHQFLLENIDRIVEREISPGGRVINKTFVDILYEDLGHMTFKQIIDSKSEVIQEGVKGPSQSAWYEELNRGRKNIGNYLDIIDLVKRERETFFTEGANIVVDSLVEHGITPFQIGYMFYPATHAQPLDNNYPTRINSEELWVDVTGGEALKEVYLKRAKLTEAQREEFDRGEATAARYWYLQAEYSSFK